MTNTLYATDYVEIHHYPEISTLSVDWIGTQTQENVIDGCMQMLKLMQKHKAYKILNDNIQVIGEWNAAAPWVGSTWFPLMAESGMVKFAWVHSLSRQSRLSTEMSLAFTNLKRIPVKAFTNHESAIVWLNDEHQ